MERNAIEIAWTELENSLGTESARKDLRTHDLAAVNPSQKRALEVERRNYNRRIKDGNQEHTGNRG